MPKRSAGILMCRGEGARLEVLLVHPGGPFWAKKDFGAWSIPKGEYEADEDPLKAAIREFEEELGSRRFRSGDAYVQSLRDGMAAEERTPTVFSGG